MGHDFDRTGEGIISEGVVAMIVRVDEVEYWLVGELANSILNLPCHLTVNPRVDYQSAARADHNSAVVSWRSTCQ